MDEVTRRVRRMYELYPYPSGEAGLRADAFPRLFLSYLSGQPQGGRPLQVLDAGCGTGRGTLTLARLHPDVRVVAADVNPVALGQVRRDAVELGLGNLLVQETDLATLEGLEVPEGGFDVILSSGVLHHLADPGRGLRNLARVLAPWGVMVLMVYGRYGRQPLLRFVEALDLARPDRDRLQSRLRFARELMASLEGGPVRRPPWNDATEVDDVEFVDRYLNVHQLSFTVEELFRLLRDSGLRQLRWLEPRDWSVWELLGPGEVAEELGSLPALVQYRIVECLADRPALELVACHRDARCRPSLRPEDLPAARIEWNPQAAVASRKRWLAGQDWYEETLVALRVGEPFPVKGVSAALVHLYRRPCTGAELVEAARQEVEVEPETAYRDLWKLLAKEVFYVP